MLSENTGLGLVKEGFVDEGELEAVLGRQVSEPTSALDQETGVLASDSVSSCAHWG